MKILQIILIIAAVILLLALLLPPAESAESKQIARAIVAYRENPSPQNKANLDHIQEVRHWADLRRDVFIGILLIADLTTLFFVSQSVRRNIGVKQN